MSWHLLLRRQTQRRASLLVYLKTGCQNTSCHVLLMVPDAQPGNKGGRGVLQVLDKTARALTLLSQKMTAGPDGKASGTLVLKRLDMRLPGSSDLSLAVLRSGQTMQSSSSYRHLDTLGACHDYHISGYALRKLHPIRSGDLQLQVCPK